ncbi:MAG: RNA-binding protein [Alphaproteobacteria bacterium]|nr:RNA-binding protein [Alphaproteobacteria bacterium]
MPKGPKGEKRPADVIGAAVMIARIATGEIEDKPSKAPGRAKGGKIGGKQRAERLSGAERTAIAKKGAAARWSRKKPT